MQQPENQGESRMDSATDTRPGFRRFHADPSLNFSLNRWLPYWREEEVREVAARIRGFADWKGVMLEQAGKAESERRYLNAAFFYRAAEFFAAPNDPEKMVAYERFIDLFYDHTDRTGYKFVAVPYDGFTLPALVFPARGERRDVLLVHCGFDSFKEEFINMALRLAAGGFEVILFEGPGQGAPLLKQHLPMPHDWERPVGAVIDHFGLESCSLLGISLGGYLAPRAAAFDKRIKRVVAFDVLEHLFDCFMDKLPSGTGTVLSWLLALRQRRVVNRIIGRRMAEDELADWGVSHGMHVSGTRDPYDFFRWAKRMSTKPIAGKITQDFLLLAGADDHLVPVRQFFSQVRTLSNVRSLTARLFTEREQAQAHCQVGNMILAIDFIIDWLTFQTGHPGQEQTAI